MTTVRDAREQALMDWAAKSKGRDVMGAVFCVADGATLRRLVDVLHLHKQVMEKKHGKNAR